MKVVVTAKQMKAIDQLAMSVGGIPAEVLMEN